MNEQADSANRFAQQQEAEASSAASVESLLEAHREAIAQQEEFNRQQFEALRASLLALVRRATADSGSSAPAAPIPVATPVISTPAVEGAGWDEVLLGRSIGGNPALAAQCRSLLQGLCSGDLAAMGLVGALLTFRSSPPDKLPRLLSQVGEAYCRWRPASAGVADPMRDSLISWLEQSCESQGMQNKVRVVQPGDRFDATRHNTKDRGVEVAEAFGWIVLRDNGKVYSKANVALR